jgi:hypothetical protein
LIALKYGAQAISGALEIAGTVLQFVNAAEETRQAKEQAKLSEDLRILNLKLEKELTLKDLDVIASQVKAAQYTLDIAIAEQQLVVKEEEMLNDTKTFLRSKFTNIELYGWFVRKLKALLKVSYGHALSAAKMAERALQFELPTDETFISSSNWSADKNGLLAAEMLMANLNQMSLFHLKNDSRFQEIKRKISLRNELLKIEDGQSFADSLDKDRVLLFNLDEKLFDTDFPGHYFRIIKTVSLSIRTGSQIVDKTLRLPRLTLVQTGNKVVTQPNFAAVESLLGDDGDEDIDPNILRIDWRSQQMATISDWEEDNGMFNTDWIFDDRYFPFEGTGAVSSWSLELGKKLNDNQVDLAEILEDPESDIVMTVKYTANFAGGKFKDSVKGKVEELAEQN